MPAIPFTAIITASAISKTIIDAAIITYVRTPVPGMPAINAGCKTPVTRCPQETNGRRRIPVTGHPVITFIAISPITRDPDIPVDRTGRLFINRNGRGRSTNRNAYAEADLRSHCCRRKTYG
jgi:hypothetical protein